MKKIILLLSLLLVFGFSQSCFAGKGIMTIYFSDRESQEISFEYQDVEDLLGILNGQKAGQFRMGRYCRILGIGTVQKDPKSEKKVYIELSCDRIFKK